MAGQPLNTSLYRKVKVRADEKFSSKSSAYKSSWIVREYKKLGGKFKGTKTEETGLTRWFREKWVDLNRPITNANGKVLGYEPCGRDSSSYGKYPLCRPTVRVNSKTPQTWKELSTKELEKARKDKRRHGGRKNVSFGTTRKRPVKKRSIKVEVIPIALAATFGALAVTSLGVWALSPFFE